MSFFFILWPLLLCLCIYMYVKVWVCVSIFVLFLSFNVVWKNKHIKISTEYFLNWSRSFPINECGYRNFNFKSTSKIFTYYYRSFNLSLSIYADLTKKRLLNISIINLKVGLKFRWKSIYLNALWKFRQYIDEV